MLANTMTSLLNKSRFGMKDMLSKKIQQVVVLAIFCMPLSSAWAQNVLKSMNYVTGTGGNVSIVMEMESEAESPVVFSTDSPARIALDLSNTSSALKERKVEIGSGATKRAIAVEAGGRTRVVVELYRQAPYELSVSGKTITLLVGSSKSVNDSIVYDSESSSSTAKRLENIDFRRGKEGEGRVILSFSEPDASVDVEENTDGFTLLIPDVDLASELEQRLDVMDFVTPVKMIDSFSKGNSVKIEVQAERPFEYLAYQTALEFVLEVKVPEIKEEEITLLNVEEKTYSGEKVSLNFPDLPIRTVLQILADFSGLNIVVGDSVEGNITLRLIQVPWDQALDIIIDSKSLDKRVNGNVIWIAPAEEIAAREQQQLKATQEKEQLEALVTDYIQINYAKAVDLAVIIEKTGGGDSDQAILSERGSITVDERTNTMLVTDVLSRIEKVRNVVDLLDVPVKQVMIESRIVIASSDFKKELGARFGVTGTHADDQGNLISTGGSLDALDRMTNTALRNRLSGAYGGNGLPNFDPELIIGAPLSGPPLNERLNVNLPVASPAGAFSFSVLAADYLLDLELSALEAEGRGEVVSSPRVITANQKEARISQGQEIAYLEASASGAAVVKFKEVALELNVVPLITPDDRIVLDLDVKKDNVASFIPGPFNSLVPIIDTRRVLTQVLVNNGETVVLGGVYESSSLESKTKVPVLGDLPAVGNLFKNTLKDEEKDELLIFVTPTILDSNFNYD